MLSASAAPDSVLSMVLSCCAVLSPVLSHPSRFTVCPCSHSTKTPSENPGNLWIFWAAKIDNSAFFML